MIIKKEEQKSKKHAIYRELREHRKEIVATEQRATLLAYGFIRGRTRKQIESKPKIQPDWDKVRAMVKKYGVRQTKIDNLWETSKQLELRRQRLLEQLEKWIEEPPKDS